MYNFFGGVVQTNSKNVYSFHYVLKQQKFRKYFLQIRLYSCSMEFSWQSDVKQEMEWMKIVLDINPGEMTNVLQPQDVNVNKTFRFQVEPVAGRSFHYLNMGIGSLKPPWNNHSKVIQKMLHQEYTEQQKQNVILFEKEEQDGSADNNLDETIMFIFDTERQKTKMCLIS